MKNIPASLTILFLAVASGASQAQFPTGSPKRDTPTGAGSTPAKVFTNSTPVPPVENTPKSAAKLPNDANKMGTGITCPPGPSPAPATDKAVNAAQKSDKNFESIGGVNCPKPAPPPATDKAPAKPDTIKPSTAPKVKQKSEKK